MPLAQLQTFRAHRAAEKERIQQLEREVATLRLKEQTREREEEDRKAREEEARRMEAERAYEERKAAAEARRLEKNRKILQEARDRRGFTRQSVLLAEPNYGAGNPLLGQHRPGLKQVTSSPSSPVLAGEASSSVGRAVQHDAAWPSCRALRARVRHARRRCCMRSTRHSGARGARWWRWSRWCRPWRVRACGRRRPRRR